MSYSQFGQDLKVINYYNNKRNGYFWKYVLLMENMNQIHIY